MTKAKQYKQVKVGEYSFDKWPLEEVEPSAAELEARKRLLAEDPTFKPIGKEETRMKKETVINKKTGKKTEYLTESLVDEEEVDGPVTNGKAHAVLAPSASKQQMNCLPSVQYASLKGDAEESEYAKEGTKAHELMEAVLTQGRKKLASCEDDEMRDAISDLYDQVEKILKAIGEKNIVSFDVEKKVRLSEHIFGTADIGIRYVKDGKKRLYICDLKYGKGVMVSAEQNTQMMIYALAYEKTFEWDWDQATLAIFQPRNRDGENPLSQWVFTKEAAKKFRKEVKGFETKALKVLRGEKHDFPFVTGEHCRFCPGKAICKSYAAYASAPALIALDKTAPLPKPLQKEEDVPAFVNSLSDDNLAVILEKRDLISAFLKEVERHITHRLQNGKKFKGYKLVAGRATRKWVEDEAAVVKELKRLGIQQPLRESLRTITDIERQLGTKDKKVLAKVTTYSDPAPKVVREDDPRPSITNKTDKLLTAIAD